jgi:K+:H+ antiporter
LRDAFAALFFMSVGMLLNPMELTSQIGLLLIGLAVVLLAKPLAAMLTLMALRHSRRIALTVPAALAQIGEFSFILANFGRELRLLPDAAINVVVAIAILSIVINPIGARLVPHVERLLAQWTWRGQPSRREDEQQASPLFAEGRSVVVGYGPTGRTVSRLLLENGIAPTIVEMNLDTVRELRQDNISAVYGDARQPATLISAGIRHAATLIISGAMPEATEVVQRAKELNPRLRVLARAAYLRDLPALRSAGVEEVFSGEGEVALAMTEAVLRQLGATQDQIDREEDRVRRELFGAA